MHSNEKASSNLCRSRWCSLDIYRGFVRFIRTVERPCWRKNEREVGNWPVRYSWTTEPVVAGSGGISVDDWKHARRGRTIVLLLFFLSFAVRPVELFALGGGGLSPMGFLPAIPRRIVFFSVFCCGLLSASARSLSPRRRIVSPSLDTFVHRFDMFDAERANEKHRRSEIGRDFPSEAQHCCHESKKRFVSCVNRWFDFSCQDIFFFSSMLKDRSVILIRLEHDRVLTRFDVPFINEILF